MPKLNEVLVANLVPHAANDNHGGCKPPCGPRPVWALSNQELRNLQDNFARTGVTVGPHYQLAEVKYEQFDRDMRRMNGAYITKVVLQLASTSVRYGVTYNDLNRALFGTKLNGPGAVATIMCALGASTLYCVKNGLPLVAAIVTRKDGTQSEKAINNLVGAAKYLGAVGDVDPLAYVQEQAARTVRLVRNDV